MADPAEGVRKVDFAMASIRSILDRASSSGEPFPAYSRWLSRISSAVRSGMSPAKIAGQRDPFETLPTEVQSLLSAGEDATDELAPYTPALPPTKDLAKLAGLKQRTQPKGLTVVLLTTLYRDDSATRAAAADHLLEAYGIDP